jgi:hypothetical protein
MDGIHWVPRLGGAEGTGRDAGSPEEDCLLLLSGSESDLWSFVTGNKSKIFKNLKISRAYKLLLIFRGK